MTRSDRLIPLPRIVFANRALRAIWQLVYILLYRPSPIVAHKWRCLLLRVFGARIASQCYPYPSARIWAPWNLEMQYGSCLADRVDCYNVEHVSLGEHALVSQKTYLCTASHDFDDSTFKLIGGPIEVKKDAWIAADAFVGPGVVIGPRAVVLARAVVVKDVAGSMVVGGNPARVIRSRKKDSDRINIE